MTTVSPTTGSYSYVDPNGDQITVSMRGDGGAVTECSNGTSTVHNPDGSSHSVNDPLGGAPVVVEITPTGDTVITYPNGSSEVVRQDGWVTHTDPDGTSVTRHPGPGPCDADQTFWNEHPVTRTAPGGVPTVGATLQGAVALGHIQDVVVISTGQNVGTVAMVECTSDGAVPFVYVPSSVLTPGNTVENQRLATHPMVIDTATPGPVSAEIPGVCRQEPFKPPADAGDTDLSLNAPPEGDLTPSIPAIVDGVVGKGVVPADLLGSPQDTAMVLTQVTTWLYNGATPEEVSRFLIPRFPSTMSDRDRQDTATELTGWGRRLVDKTNNLGKQKAARPPDVPPVFYDGSVSLRGPGLPPLPPQTPVSGTPGGKVPRAAPKENTTPFDDAYPKTLDAQPKVTEPKQQVPMTAEKPATQTPKTAEKEKPHGQKTAEYDEQVRQARERRKREKLNQRDYDALKREFEREQESLRKRSEEARKALEDFHKDLDWREKHHPQDKDGIGKDRERIRSIEKEIADLFERQRDLWKTPPYDMLQKGVRPYEVDELPDAKPKPEAAAPAPKSSSGQPPSPKPELEKPSASPPAAPARSGGPVGGPVEP